MAKSPAETIQIYQSGLSNRGTDLSITLKRTFLQQEIHFPDILDKDSDLCLSYCPCLAFAWSCLAFAWSCRIAKSGRNALNKDHTVQTTSLVFLLTKNNITSTLLIITDLGDPCEHARECERECELERES